MAIIYHATIQDIMNYMFTWIYKCTQIYLKPPLGRFMTMNFIIINGKLPGNRIYLMYGQMDLKKKATNLIKVRKLEMFAFSYN